MRIGVLGGGQLARMLAEAGLPLGIDFDFLDPKSEICAARYGRHIQAEWDDPSALEMLARCDRITCDFENVPAGVLDALARHSLVRPGATALAAAQDRLTEKELFRDLGLETPEFAAVDSRPDLHAAVERIGLPSVLKTRRMGYDGKGQMVLRDAEDLELAWQKLGGQALILERWVDFDHECSITAVRAADGALRCWPLTRTWHDDGILRLAWAPSRVAGQLQRRAESLITRLAEKLDYVGCLTLELFVGDAFDEPDRDGLERRLIANEFAPRVHNSAHWTIEAAQCSQFENHLRAVCGWPLGETHAVGQALMVNFIGELPPIARWLATSGLHWHDYGKSARPGRKVGHATLVGDNPEQLVTRVAGLRNQLDSRSNQALDSMAADSRGSNSTRC
ncbi:MAG: 5-(carboxyamino)imidazole ribonucleotide synthase [Xanthomonadaceae bacterium]|nr:5-(carboxyamino)imidazole ribonucleotide synthase [Xanthomonadaceae bacterium]